MHRLLLLKRMRRPLTFESEKFHYWWEAENTKLGYVSSDPSGHCWSDLQSLNYGMYRESGYNVFSHFGQTKSAGLSRKRVCSKMLSVSRALQHKFPKGFLNLHMGKGRYQIENY
jgi:hypothetical protein